MSITRSQPRDDLRVLQGAGDTERVRAALDAWFMAHGRDERVATIELRRVFYVPAVECSAVYDVALQRNGSRESQVLTARPFDAAAGERWAGKAERKGRNGKFAIPALGAPAYHLRDIGLVLWTFPNDPHLKTLGVHAQRPAGEIVAQLAATTGRAELALGDATRTAVRYIPSKRCVFRYDTGGADGSEAAVLYAKVYEDSAPARDAHEVLEALWRATRADTGMLRVPEPLALDAEARTTYQRAVAGDAMVARAATLAPAEAAAIGRALARLHLLRLPVRAAFRLEDEFDKLTARAPAISSLHAGVAARIDALVARLGDALPALPRLPLVPAHGTFKLAHLVHDGSRLGLVDFDSFVQADPLYDVANFIADLHYLEAAGAVAPGRAARLGAALYDAWSAYVPWGRRDAVLDWYVASLLVRKQAMKCVKHLHTDAAGKIDSVLAAAERRVPGGTP